MERGVPLGKLNLGADMLSQSNVPSDEWTLHPQTVQEIWGIFGRPEVDLFTSKDNTYWLNLYKWFRMQRHDWSSTSPKELMLHLSLSPCTGYRLQLASSSKHWCLHIDQPQAQHLPTSTHYYESTSPPEAPPTSTHYYESTSPPEVWEV